MKRLFQYSIAGLLGVTAVAYGLDAAVAGLRKDEFSTVKVDQIYAVTNRWNQVDYSIGDPKNERCVNALFPHSGASPCWYVTSHTMRINRSG